MALNRRHFIKNATAGLGWLALNASQSAAAQTNKSAKVVVIGGGFAGATCAKFLKQFNPELDVTLIEKNAVYTACPLSNMVVGGYRALERQQFNYQALTKLGIRLVIDGAAQVDTEKQFVLTEQGARYEYHRLVVAPGIDIRWNAIDGYDQKAAESMPHAWKAGTQTLLLRKQLQAMSDGGLVVITVPNSPYRCPPGPYERASLVASYLKQYKPKSKLLVLDAKDSFSKKPLFTEGWQKLYSGIIEWQGLSDGASVTAVNAKTNTVLTDFDAFKADVANIIPPQQAGAIARLAGLTNSSGWCPITPLTFESSLQSKVHVLGDAAIANAMPKSAFSANAQAKYCALQIVRLLNGEEPITTKLINTCYSLLAPNYGVSVADVFSPGQQAWEVEKGAGGISPLGADELVRAKEATYAINWFDTVTREAFG